ncbi:MAG: HAMP domain-containing histidine kinase [Planctomycetes bacterium]|nr:HAMP domain-containing histidine kinase [Planctomycetota bacterium]
MLDTLRTQSFRYAVALALAYGLTAALYILVSSRMAADISHDVEEMKRIETVKGIVYVAVTAVLVWAGAWWAMRRMARDAEELRRRERALVTAEGRVFAGLMASSVAHDANNVLLTVLTEAEELAGNVLPGQREGAQRLSRAVERLIQLNRRLMSASHQGLARDRQPVDLLLAVRECVHDMRSNRHVRGCRVEVRGAGDAIVMANPMVVQQSLANLLLNAAQATSGQGTIEVRVEHRSDGVAVEIHDDGPGVERERRAHLFDALETTKPDGNGLGLFSVRACAESFGGRMEIDESPLGGALFRIVVPESARVVHA